MQLKKMEEKDNVKGKENVKGKQKTVGLVKQDNTRVTGTRKNSSLDPHDSG